MWIAIDLILRPSFVFKMYIVFFFLHKLFEFKIGKFSPLHQHSFMADKLQVQKNGKINENTFLFILQIRVKMTKIFFCVIQKHKFFLEKRLFNFFKNKFYD